MTLDEMHTLLHGECGLVYDRCERGCGRTYFWREVRWAPQQTTRVLHVQCDAGGRVIHVRRCVSSDNNNSVFIRPPFRRELLRALVAEEIALLPPACRDGGSRETGPAAQRS